MSDAFRAVIAGGGTGGHVFPALALAEALGEVAPGAELLFVGSVGGLEERLVPAAGHRLEVLKVAKLRGVAAGARVAALAGLPLATLRAAALLRGFAPNVVVGVGGFASAPVTLAATALRLPVVLLEQNAVPGTVNRALARLSRLVVIAFKGAARYLPTDKAVLLGNPVRPGLLRALAAANTAGRGGAAPRLLVLGGSQGAHAVNRLVCEAVPLLRGQEQLTVHHQTGSADREWVERAYRAAGVSARVEAFIDEIGPALARATLVVGRSGATTLAELSAAGVPALLIPYPHAADDHQAANAEELVQAGGALMRRQEALDPGELAGLLGELLGDRQRLEAMSRAMQASGRPEAARQIATLLIDRFGG